MDFIFLPEFSVILVFWAMWRKRIIIRGSETEPDLVMYLALWLFTVLQRHTRNECHVVLHQFSEIKKILWASVFDQHTLKGNIFFCKYAFLILLLDFREVFYSSSTSGSNIITFRKSAWSTPSSCNAHTLSIIIWSFFIW